MFVIVVSYSISTGVSMSPKLKVIVLPLTDVVPETVPVLVLS